MKKLILASMILLATGAAQATVSGLATSGSGTTAVAGQNTVQIALTSNAQQPQTPINVVYSPSSNSVTGSHSIGAVAQYAAITVPATTQKVVLSVPTIEGTNQAHAAVSIIADVTNTAGDTDKIAANAAGSDTLYVGLVAADSTAWVGGETTGLTTVTFYAS
ncbi:hypothetical protein D4F06_25470 [Salmonella enterica subsp. enterica serovar Muenchen]|nr:hypothetical protein [Salmonella enterica subsp. enterica serovar Muenchen]EBY3557604.1 hypothetical protein [Salmonella enterica subsp. enterica serovar Muenchen]